MSKATRFVVVLSVCSLILTFAFVSPAVASTVEVPLFGPEQFVRDTGSPVTETRQFSVQRLVADSYVLRVGNGSMEGDSLVSSAVITLNGTVVLKQSDFNQGVYNLEKPVAVQAINTLEVKLSSIPTSYLTITIIGNYLPEDVDDDGDGYTENEGDCNDADALVNPDAPEICDGIDNNCSGIADEGVTTTYYLDADGDGYGLLASTVEACVLPVGYSGNSDDCVDTDSAINPTTVWYEDADGDGYTTGLTLTQCMQPAGYVLTADPGDCDDSDPAVSPAATEVCNSIDDNCDAVVDEGVTLTFYPDADGDGYGISTGSIQACSAPAGYAASSGDCDDLSFDVNPGAAEVCDGIDNNCDGTTDPGCLTGITVAPETFTLTGTTSTQQLTVTGYYSDNTSLGLTGSSTGTVYTSSDINVAGVTPEGLVTAAGTGTAVVTAANGGFTTDATVTVQMLPATYVPQPEGSFGAFYEDLVPSDVAVESYDVKRFSVVTGLVQAKDGAPISGVTVSIHGHPEYGTVLTDADGRFSIPVEGEGTMTVVYGKTGLLSSHRKVYVPWNDIAVVDTITMIQQDYVTTQVMFDGNPATTYTHRATETVDEFGTRALTMIIKGDNRAYKLDEAGNQIWLPIINIRATEYETPESMPAKLPPNSGYTYCTELSVDEAENVWFEKPITTFVDNFLGFDVGMAVPVGYYDRVRAVWIPANNGVVVRLLDTDSDGIADALDSTGDNQPNDLNNNGLFSDEVQGLTDPAKYPPNETFWRVMISHFTPWDANWPVGLPTDASPPTFEGVPEIDQQVCETKSCKTTLNSFVEHRSRIFHEDIPILGTGFKLHFASNRVNGYKTVITIPASGISVPASLKQIVVRVTLAGRTLESLFPPLPNQKTEIVWDGLDWLGRPLSGQIMTDVEIGFVYNGVYLTPGNFVRAFSQAGNQATGIDARQEVTSWSRFKIPVRRNGSMGTIANGWSISSHHLTSENNMSVLFKGDGTTLVNSAWIIDKIAGNTNPSAHGSPVDGDVANEAVMTPLSMDIGRKGYVYFGDGWRIWKIDSTGILNLIGGGGYESAADGEPAKFANLSIPWNIKVEKNGGVLFTNGSRVREIDANGILHTVAGTGEEGFSGDGGSATNAKINYANGLAIDEIGNIYVSDYWYSWVAGGRGKIRKIDTNGIITTVAYISAPGSIEVDDEGNIFVIDGYYQHGVKKISTDGSITIVAGYPYAYATSNYSYPGQLATEIQLDADDISIGREGDLYISDNLTNLLLRVDNKGHTTSVAGTGNGGYEGDGGPATQANITVDLIDIDLAGNKYITSPRSIRKIFRSSDLTGAIAATEGNFYEDGLGYSLDSSGLHQATVDLNSGMPLLGFAYNPNDLLVSITDRFGNVTSIQRNATGVPLSITSPDGIVTTLTVNANGDLDRVSYPDGTYYDLDYAPGGLLTDIYEPNGARFTHAFDPSGRVTDVRDPEGGHWNFSRSMDTVGNITSSVLTAEDDQTTYFDRTYSTGEYSSIITGPDGSQTTFDQSSDGLTAEKQTACGVDMTFDYDLDDEYKYKFVDGSSIAMPSGLSVATSIDRSYTDTDSDGAPDRITDTVTVNGKASTVVNDVLADTVTATSPTGRQVTSYYSPATLLTSRTSTPGLLDTDFTYDARGRLDTVTVGSRTTSFAYDGFGYLDYMTTPDGRTFDYTYDVMGRLTNEVRPDGGQVSYSYDPNGNVTAILNPNTITHGFTYTANDQRESYNTPVSGSYVYQYDRDRRLKSVTYPSGQGITNTWGSGQLQSTSTPEGLISYGYDCGGKLASVTKGGESASYTYDGLLLLTDTRAGTVSGTIGYTYDSDLRVASIAYAGILDSFTYDNDGLLTGAGAYTITRNVSNGLPEAVSDGTVTQGRSFSGYGEVDGVNYTVGAATPYSWGVVRDNVGHITEKVENIGTDTITWDYTYDLMGRLETVYKDSALAEAYSYDGQGNRITETNNLRNVSRSYTNSVEDHTLTAGADSYTFDVDGFLISRTIASGAYSGTATFDYSSRGELLNASLPNGDTITYDHDPMGRRISKSVNGVVVEKYLWGSATTLLAVYDGFDNLIQRFEYADGRMPVSMVYSGVVYYLAYDQVGSLRIVTDAAGTIVKRIDYDSFGNILSDSNPSFSVPFGFAGGLHDRDTGLVRFGARDYDPVTGKWAAKDPIDFGGEDLNLFGYVQNDPVNWVDPEGLVNWGQIVAGLLETGSAGLHYWMGATITSLGGPIGLGFGIGLGVVATGELALGIHNVWEGIWTDWEPSKTEQNMPCKE